MEENFAEHTPVSAEGADAAKLLPWVHNAIFNAKRNGDFRLIEDPVPDLKRTLRKVCPEGGRIPPPASALPRYPPALHARILHPFEKRTPPRNACPDRGGIEQSRRLFAGQISSEPEPD
ncbi:MAG: hypothetical protein AAGN35_14170 [Bacteroidota bacterium]